MRTRSCISRIGIAVLVSIYSASSVEITGGKRRNRKLIRHSGGHEGEKKKSKGENSQGSSRFLSVGLDHLKYGNGAGQYHIESTRSKDSKGKSKGTYYSDNYSGKGKGSYSSYGKGSSANYGKGSSASYGKGSSSYYGKGSGKGSSRLGVSDSEDSPYISSTNPPSLAPSTSTKNSRPTHQQKEHGSSKKGKHSKLTKSDKTLSTLRPASQPTRTPTPDIIGSTPTPSYTSTDKSNTIPPSSTGDILVSLTPFKILYALTENDRPPFRSELLEVVELTRIYIDRFFSSNYVTSELTNLSKVMTIFKLAGFDFDEDVPINYESKAVLKPSTVILPEKEDLDSILISAFEGENLDGYIGLLQALPPSNMFSSVEYIKLIQMVEDNRTRESGTKRNAMAKSMTLGAIAVGGIAGLVLIFASSRVLRQRSRHDSDRSIFGNKSSSTSTGETFLSHGSGQAERMFRPICDELYDSVNENRR